MHGALLMRRNSRNRAIVPPRAGARGRNGVNGDRCGSQRVSARKAQDHVASAHVGANTPPSPIAHPLGNCAPACRPREPVLF
ncbi:hypothetical protein WS62_00645 [Burkholderia sp. ABCPW 14]|uniref:Uncharacterized protein n=1 Tax=Burkholderia mayonis TaxID=1385591 RepID=A0A1B4G0C6_9BURK|nr:hypothetical protein WS71_18710 [Burkholderia mayonis]KVD77922.1 hypothetical protein WS62_00645 [Burkholderia sp. ABCPW 14]KVE57487.1 hypothetical protein WS71_27720 [Burkholderia mayonis]